MDHHYSIYPDSYGSVEPYRTRRYLAGPPGALGGALHYGEVRAESAAEAYLALTRKETGIAMFC